MITNVQSERSQLDRGEIIQALVSVVLHLYLHYLPGAGR